MRPNKEIKSADSKKSHLVLCQPHAHQDYLFSLGTCLKCIQSHLHPHHHNKQGVIMKGTVKYRSPAKIKRYISRLIAYLFKSIHTNQAVSDKKIENLEINTRTSFSIEPATLTSYPEPCTVCKNQQCEFDFCPKRCICRTIGKLW